ncbi:hypothetical protein GQ53DRAFT_812063 [Thozetella sp. PMI_491]|nr:hypothetical protein GQ53DRAFT_812063 [Thozetella sp. PMI_491]
MTTSTMTTQLGRHLWSSFRDSVDIIASRLPHRYRPLNAIGLGQSFHCTPQPVPAFPSSRWFSLPSQARMSRGQMRRSCTSGGLLLLGLNSSPTSANSVVATCTAAADSALSGSIGQRANIAHLARQAWRSSLQDGRKGQAQVLAKRKKSSKTETEATRSTPSSQKPLAEGDKPPPSTTPQAPASETETLANSMSKYLHLPHLPKMPHRPTKEELLAAASGFWSRLKVRFKWASIRSMRPWNADEWGAFVTWFLFGHLVWILVGTTTFFSLLILFINTVFAQETLAKWIGDYLTQSAGLTVVFESAIVPKWKDGVISFRNVFVSRRPGQSKSSVKKGSSGQAAEAAAAKKVDPETAVEVPEDDGNYTQFDVTISTVNVTLSFAKWWNGKGLLRDVEVKGVRGVVDRTSVHWSAEGKDPLSYRHEHQPGDFELEHFKMEDLLVTIHQPDGFRPFSVSIYSCELPQLRKQWLFYDFLSASHMSGSFDGSLFTIHPRQIHGVASVNGNPASEEEASLWKKFSRIRIDGLKIDHLNRGIEGPFGWIYEGNVDIVADIMFPADANEGIGKVVAEFYDKMEEAVTSNRYLKILEGNIPLSKSRNNKAVEEPQELCNGDNILNTPEEPASQPPELISDPASAQPSPVEEAPSYLVMDMRVHLNDVRAAVPLFSNPHMSYVNQALVRPIVAYINAKRTYIPISCRIVKRATDFDGSWSSWDCGLMDDLGAEVYSAFARNVEDQQTRVRRFKRVGLWTVSLVVHAMLAGVAGDLI